MRVRDFILRDILRGKLIRNDNPRASTKFIKSKFKNDELVGVEIGTCEGYNALSLIKNLNIKSLFLVDPYLEYENFTDSNPNLTWAERKAKRKLRKYRKRLKWIKKLSTDAVKDIPDNLDFVYIDGNHSYEYVCEDIKNYYLKLKKGGILSGHDIENGLCLEREGVVKAVLEFVNEKKLKLFIHAPDWWIVKK